VLVLIGRLWHGAKKNRPVAISSGHDRWVVAVGGLRGQQGDDDTANDHRARSDNGDCYGRDKYATRSYYGHDDYSRGHHHIEECAWSARQSQESSADYLSGMPSDRYRRGRQGSGQPRFLH
jgi:hypothetical protein